MATPDVSAEIQPMPSHAVERPQGVEITPEESAALVAERAAALTTTADLPKLSIDAVNYAQANFGRMDGNGDGHVSDYELDGYIKANEKKFSKEESDLVYQIKDNRDKIEEASNDEWGDENDGFTQQDLVLVRSDATASAGGAVPSYDAGNGDLRPALNYANKNFAKLDADKDGFINNNEISQYMTDNELSTSEVRMLRNLRDRSTAVGLANNDGDSPFDPKGLSKGDLSATNEQINNLTFAAENFSALDANGNGHVTKEEIIGYERARDDLSGQELRALDALKKQVDQLDDLHNDESGDENDGFTGYDILDGMTALGSPNAKGQNKLEAPSVEVASTTPPNGDGDGDGTADTPANPDGTDNAIKERTHTVSPNETLWKICADELRSRNGGSRPSNNEVLSAIRAVENCNPGLDRDRIKPGQEIKIPVDLNAPPRIREGEPDPNGPIRRPGPELPPRNPGEPRLPPHERPNPPSGREQPIPPRGDERRTEQEKSDPDVLRQYWRGIDRSGDNRVSREEIQDFVRNNQRNLTMKEITALGRMAAREGKIQELENDERGDENSGISMRDLQKAEQLQAAAQYLLRRDVMENLNINGDRFVDKRELDYALRTQNMRPQDRAMLNYLRTNYAKFQEGANNERGDENSGVSMQDLQYYAGLV